MDVAELRAYAQGVSGETDGWLAVPLSRRLERPTGPDARGFGQHTLGLATALLVANHPGPDTGEIAVLKGIQAAHGYPL